MRQEGEPSVEEILESIKRVIERDNAESVQIARNKADGEGDPVAADQDRSALPLTASESDATDQVLDLGQAGSQLDDEAQDAETEADHPDHADAEDDLAAETLTNDRAADAMRHSLAALAMLSEPPARPQVVRSGETSLEGLVRELLRPMLAQWLDTNLPDVVERLVKAEIARIASKKG